MSKYDNISEIISGIIKEKIIPGASYSFIKLLTDEKEEISNYYLGNAGVIKPFDSIIVKENMIYDLASLTKVIGTTTRILQLCEEKKINLSQEIGSILTNFNYSGVTIENLLLHTSGLPSGVMDKKTFLKENAINIIYDTPLIYETNTKSLYSDIGFIFLGFIIKKVDSMSLDDSFKKNIFNKLNMKNTSYIANDNNSLYIPTEYTKERGCIVGEVHDNKAYVLGESGSAGLFSTLNDLVLFAKSILKDDEKILSKDTIEKLKNITVFDRSYGWDKKYGNNILYHTGFTGTSMLLDLEKKEGFILLTNRIHPSRDNEKFIEVRDKLNKLFIGDIGL